MKKLLLASAVAALSITAAQAAPTVYGKAFLTLDAADTNRGPADRVQLNSNASRIGVKGSEALTQNTDVVYQLEYRVDIDSDAARNWESRDTYIGLSNKQYGTLVAGRLTAIDSAVDYANVTVGSVVGGDAVLATIDAPRANNAFAYFSPVKNGVQFLAMYALDENSEDTLEDKGDKAVAGGQVVADVYRAKQGLDTFGGDAFGVGVKYEPENQPFKVGATYLEANQAGENGKSLKAVRVSGSYDINAGLTAGALYQHTDFRTNKDENAFTLSASQKVAQTPWTVYGQLDLVDNVGGSRDLENKRLAVGGKYAFNKNATAHVYGATLRSEVANFNTNTYGIGAGLEYKF